MTIIVLIDLFKDFLDRFFRFLRIFQEMNDLFKCYRARMIDIKILESLLKMAFIESIFRIYTRYKELRIINKPRAVGINNSH